MHSTFFESTTHFCETPQITYAGSLEHVRGKTKFAAPLSSYQQPLRAHMWTTRQTANTMGSAPLRSDEYIYDFRLPQSHSCPLIQWDWSRQVGFGCPIMPFLGNIVGRNCVMWVHSLMSCHTAYITAVA
jgi:hypothetical protein